MNGRGKLEIVAPGDYPRQIQGSPQTERLAPYGDVTLFTDVAPTMEEQIERVRGAQVILNTRSSSRWPGDALRQLPELRVISVCAVGTDNIDLNVASELGIAVCNLPGWTAPVVAEHTIALMFAAAKRAAFHTAELKAGRWKIEEAVYLKGKTLGVIGTGTIGGLVAETARALGMRVIAWTFNPSRQRAEELGVEYVDLEDLLRESDVVTLHPRLTDQTRGMLGRGEFKMMKPGAILVNCGRGQMVDTAALVDALNSGHLGGAALDVFDPEPLPADHPLLACRQVVLTPHMADQTPEGLELLNKGVVENVIAFLEGRPQNLVQP